MVSAQASGVVIGPMGVGEVLDAGLNLARRNYRRLVYIVACGLIPLYVLIAASNLVQPTTASTSTFTSLDLARAPAVIAVAVAAVAVGLAALILASLASVAGMVAASNLIAGADSDRLGAGALYRIAWARLGSLILLGLIAAVLAIPLMILFPLGIYLLVRWALAYTVIVVEGVGPIASLRRSWQLTRRAWWHTLALMILMVILLSILEGIVGGVLGIMGGILDALGSLVLGRFLTTLGSALSAILAAPFAAAITVVLYYELRARNEGLDLEVRAQQM